MASYRAYPPILVRYGEDEAARPETKELLSPHNHHRRVEDSKRMEKNTMDEKLELGSPGLPPYTERPGGPKRPFWRRRHVRRQRTAKVLVLACLAFITYAQWRQMSPLQRVRPDPSPTSPALTTFGLSVQRLQAEQATCVQLRAKPQDPVGLGRERSERYVDGHPAVLIRNATVWVGEAAAGTSAADARAGKGWSWERELDVFLEHGLIKRVEQGIAAADLPHDTVVFDARGRPLTAGLIDMHSHAGVDSLPGLVGNADTNEMASDITPYVRSIDGIQPGDQQIQVIKSGGVTTSLVLPGSANNMGGEAYVVKHAVGRADGRNETSATDMLADPGRNWRYMKMACGENAKRIYGRPGERGPTSRLGESWEFRHAFEQAARLVALQDDWCALADSVGAENMRSYLPLELKWESLGALLRGQVHLNTHCYTVPDLEAFVDHTNEFKFRVRAFHHAHQTYLVPEILKRAYGGDPPASAIFADNMWYKAESYVGSEYAGKYLYDNELTPIYVSDNPVLNAQHVLLEAAKGYRYGLPYHAALAAVTTAPAERLGLQERLGKVKPGFDADVVVWDSDPLSVGATPAQVWIDGTAQFENPFVLDKPVGDMIVPDENLANIVEEPTLLEDVVFTGIAKVLLPDTEVQGTVDGTKINVAVSHGKITCVGECAAELQAASHPNSKAQVVALRNGYVTESFTAILSTLGLNAIDAERDTDNGADGDMAFSRGVDGLALGTKKLAVAHRYGVTKALSAPKFAGGATHHGISVGFLTGAPATVLDEGVVFASDVAVHYTLDLSAKRGNTPSISAAVGALRKKLLDAAAHNKTEDAADDSYSEAAYLRRVVTGEMPIGIMAHSADTIAAVLNVKHEVETAVGAALRVFIIGGAESHLVADALAAAKVGVVLAPLQSYAYSWVERRALPGAPLSNGTAVDALLNACVPVAIGMEEDWLVRDLSLLAGVVRRNHAGPTCGGKKGMMSEAEALALAGGNIYRMLGIEEPRDGHFVVFEGSPLEIGGRVKAVAGGMGVVSIF